MEPYRGPQEPCFYIGTNAHVLCLEQATGSIRWKAKPFAYGSVVSLLLADSRIYAATYCAAACLDEATGKELWKSEIADLSEPVAMALDPTRGQLLLTCNGLVFSVAAETGALMWKNELKGLGYSHVTLRVPGAITSQPLWATVKSGKSSRTEMYENDQER